MIILYGAMFDFADETEIEFCVGTSNIYLLHLLSIGDAFQEIHIKDRFNKRKQETQME